LRISLTANHTREQLDEALRAIDDAAQEIDLPRTRVA
jgi:hypothetical protein